MIRTVSPRRTLAVGGIAVAALSLTACGGSDDAAGAGDLDAFCAQYEVLDNQEDFDEDTVINELKGLRDLAPDEIKGDFETAISAFETLTDVTARLEAGEDVDVEDPAVEQATEDLDVTGDRIEEYVTEACGLELGS